MKMSGTIEVPQDGATHVMVCGQIFDWLLKGPFRASGHSVEGALELDSAGRVKCHSCGKWVFDLAAHIATELKWKSQRHQPARAYKLRHGLNFSTPLLSPTAKKNRLKRVRGEKFQAQRGRSLPSPALLGPLVSKAHAERRNAALSGHPENLNLIGACRAQRMRELENLIIRLGRRPKARELMGYISPVSGRKVLTYCALEHLFGEKVRSIVNLAMHNINHRIFQGTSLEATESTAHLQS